MMDIVVVLLALFPILGFLWLCGWMAWKENRAGGITDWHRRRIEELHSELGTRPKEDPAGLSWKEGVQETSRLTTDVERKRSLERTYARLNAPDE